MENKPTRLIGLKDGYVANIKDDWDVVSGGGCPTCGYDGMYTSEMEFIIYDYNKGEYRSFTISDSEYYVFLFSVSDILIMFIDNLHNFKNMTIEEFKEWLEETLVG